MKITHVLFAPGLGGFYFDDQRAIKGEAEQDGFAYRGNPITPGFTDIRQAGEAVSVMLVLEDGQVAWGDCAAVQYSGAGGRDPVFLAGRYLPTLIHEVGPRLVGMELDRFRPLAETFDELRDTDGNRYHTAIRYGLTQAILDGVARSQKVTMAEVLADEYGTSPTWQPVPIFTQSGDDRRHNADKMIIKRAQVLPHGLINNVKTKLGQDGGLLLEYVGWLAGRIAALGPADYCPVLHIDVYGTIGLAFDGDPGEMAEYIGRLRKAAGRHVLRVEGPMDAGSKAAQIEAMRGLRMELRRRGVDVQIVADEWCNTFEDYRDFVDAEAVDMLQIKTPVLGGINRSIEAVLYCKSRGVGTYLGGTCNETDRSAQISVHMALATQPDQMLAKPGMGVDEGLLVVYNEMQRTLALIRARRELETAGAEMRAL